MKKLLRALKQWTLLIAIVVGAVGHSFFSQFTWLAPWLLASKMCIRDRFVPATLYSRQNGGNEPATPSPFVRELPFSALEEWQEGYTGRISKRSTSCLLYTSVPPAKPDGGRWCGSCRSPRPR